jgi:hypothetical protein
LLYRLRIVPVPCAVGAQTVAHGLGEACLTLSIAYHVKAPGLTVMRGRCTRCRTHHVGDQIVGYRFGRETPDRTPTGDGCVQAGHIVAELSVDGAG